MSQSRSTKNVPSRGPGKGLSLGGQRTACAWLLLVALSAGEYMASAATFEALGTAVTPAPFPRHSGRDVEDMFRLAKQAGDFGVFIYQWGQPEFRDVATKLIPTAKNAGLTPILGLSPTRLNGARGEFDVPAAVRRNSGRNLSFRDRKVYEPFIADAFELARLKVPYLCLATEINFLAFKDIREYINFAAIYKRLYAEVKKISPDTKVFVSFQWDYFYIMDKRDSAPSKIKENSKLIDIFRPELDVAAFTSYPSDHFRSPDAIPANYYERIYEHINRSDEVMFMEIGWPTTGKGNDATQVEFIQRLPALMAKIKPKVVAWSLLHDVGSGALQGDLGSTGLIDNSGQKKPGFKAFQDLRNK